MGASTFTNFGPDRELDAQKSFESLTRAARHEHGHGGYSGTIAEKHSFVVIQATPVNPEAAYELADRLIDAADPRIDNKWGPAGAIRVKGERFDGWCFFGWASD